MMPVNMESPSFHHRGTETQRRQDREITEK
jgi:hypothetical protein